MTDEAQRIAIAKVHGYSWNCEPFFPDEPDGKKWYRVDHPGGTQSCGFTLVSELPDYLSDLNAMHEAEEVLFAMANTNEEAYSHQLTCVTRGWRTYRATARQRATALLRTLNKWEDGK